jgi:hypothetical protein
MTVFKNFIAAIPKQKLLSVLLPCLAGWAFTYWSVNGFNDYGLTLFIWLPFLLGSTSTLILGYKNDTTRVTQRNNSLLTLLLFCFGLLLFAWEGIICLIMAAPIGLVSTYFGFLLGNYILNSGLKKQTPAAVILFMLASPALMAFEDIVGENETLRSVVTTIEIDAAPSKVWQNVVSFPQLKEPTEFVFKTGIAYPINATIVGTGVGAVRHCNFSTGSFVEPITVWDEPRLLKFSVEQQPEPMKEISPYDIHPNHLHGYWVSKQGQFKLTALANGHTLLEGTTWYINKIKPGFYWTLWSDHIVHKIHNRVLEHIKEQSELQK